MGRQVGADAHLAQARAVQEQLAAQGITNNEIEKLFAQPGKLDAILSDNRLLLQYFQVQSRGLTALTSWDFDNPFISVSGQTPPPTDPSYAMYYSADRNPLGRVPGQDFFPEDLLFNTDALVQNGYFTADQGYYWNQLTTQGLYGDGGGGGAAGPKIGAMAVSPVKGMAAGGGVKRLGPTGGGTPPAPPPGGGVPTANLGPTGGWPGMPGSPGFNAEAFNYISSLDPGADREMLMGLFGDESYANGVIYNAMQNIDSQKRTVQDIQNFIAGIDTNTPEGRHQVMVANQQLGTLQGNIREHMDAIMNLKKRLDERKMYIKGIMDLAGKASETIVRNVGR
jgi:hypothetical protein